MGIIQRQALRNTIVSFSGAFIGGVNRMLMVLLITPSQIGLLGILESISGFLVVIFNMGFNQVVLAIFPKYRDDESGHHGFLAFGLSLSLIGIILAFITFYFFGDFFLKKDTDLALFQRFSFLIFPIIFFRIVFTNLDGYLRMLYNSFVGSFFESFLSKFFAAIAILLLWLLVIEFDVFVYLYALSFCLPGILILFVAFRATSKITMPHRKLFEREQLKGISGHILFGILTGASASIIVFIDQLMIGKMLSLEMVGYYTTFFLAARFVLIPSTAISKIAQVVVSEAWKEKDFETVQAIYRKSCVNQLMIACFLIGLGWTLLDPALTLSPKLQAYSPYKIVFLILGLGIITEMATGLNALIIAVSPKYRYNTYFALLLAVMLIITNYFLIKVFALTGAAIASFLVMLVINFLRWFMLVKTYKLQPFDLNFLKAVIVSGVFMAVCILFDYEASAWVKIILNSVVLTLGFWLVVVALKLSPDINNWLDKMRNKFFKKTKS